MRMPAAKKAKTAKADESGVQKLPQLRESDALLIFIAKCIAERLDQLGILLTAKYGKGRVQDDFIEFLTKKSGNHICMGKAATSRETLANWVNKGIKLAQEETARRATGGSGEDYVSVPEVSTEWFNLMTKWTVYMQAKGSTTARWTPPACYFTARELLWRNDDSPCSCNVAGVALLRLIRPKVKRRDARPSLSCLISAVPDLAPARLLEASNNRIQTTRRPRPQPARPPILRRRRGRERSSERGTTCGSQRSWKWSGTRRCAGASPRTTPSWRRSTS